MPQPRFRTPARERSDIFYKMPDEETLSIKFDEENRNWTPNPESNALFLKQQQNFFNNALTVGRVVFLNEVYEALGFDRTKDGAIVGWDPESSPEGLFTYQWAGGDLWIDFHDLEIVFDRV